MSQIEIVIADNGMCSEYCDLYATGPQGNHRCNSGFDDACVPGKKCPGPGTYHLVPAAQWEAATAMATEILAYAKSVNAPPGWTLEKYGEGVLACATRARAALGEARND